MGILNLFIILSILYLNFAVAQIADCKKIFSTSTVPGWYYWIYPLDLNGIPYGMRSTNYYDWVSRLGFNGQPLYSGNTKDITVNAFLTSDTNNTQFGEVYGNYFTTSNFTLSASAWFVPKISGWHRFVLTTRSAGELMIMNNTSAYCCDNPTNNSIGEQFIITSIPSMPEYNNPQGSVYLYAGFKYEMITTFVNQHGIAYYSLYFVDPAGYYQDMNSYVYQMNNQDSSELVTCNYGVGYFTTTVPWGGTAITTGYQQYFKVQESNFVTIQDWVLIGIPSTMYATSTESSSTFLQSSNTPSSNSTNDLSSILSTGMTVPGAATQCSSISPPESASVTSNESSSITSMESSTISSRGYSGITSIKSSNFFGNVSINLYNDASDFLSFESVATDIETSSLPELRTSSDRNILSDSLSSTSEISSSTTHIPTLSTLSPSLPDSISSRSSEGSIIGFSATQVTNKAGRVSDSNTPSSRIASVASSSIETIELYVSTTQNSDISPIIYAPTVGASNQSHSSSSRAVRSISENESQHLEADSTTENSVIISTHTFTTTESSIVPTATTTISTANTDQLFYQGASPSLSEQNFVTTVYTTTIVQTDGYHFVGQISIAGLSDDLEKFSKRTITTIITSTICSQCVGTATIAQQEGLLSSQKAISTSNNVYVVPSVALVNTAVSNSEQSTSQVSLSVKPSAGVQTFAVSPNGQPRFDIGLSGIMLFVFSAFVLLL